MSIQLQLPGKVLEERSLYLLCRLEGAGLPNQEVPWKFRRMFWTWRMLRWKMQM